MKKVNAFNAKEIHFVIMLIIVLIIFYYSCKKDDNPVSWPASTLVVEKYKGYEIVDDLFNTAYPFSWHHFQEGTSIHLTEGWIHLYPVSQTYYRIFSGYTEDYKKSADLVKYYERWTDTVSGTYRFTSDSSYIILSKYLSDDSCKYICGLDTIIEHEGTFVRDHLFVYGTFKYKKYPSGY